MNDKELIQQILSGNMNAFTFLVKQHQKLVAHLVYRIVQQQDDVEDVCQEVFIKVFRNLKHFRGDSKLSTWIASIAYNSSISYLKKKKKFAHQEIDLQGSDQLFANEGQPQIVLEKAELKIFIQQKIEELPEHFRTVITLFHMQEFSYKEIEEITGLPEGTIKTHLFRARKILKEKLIFVNQLQGEK
jgi:RNA polymerase sigma-70 factor (ECF subfamily)